MGKKNRKKSWMIQTMEKAAKLIHVATIAAQHPGKSYLLLRQNDTLSFTWFEEQPDYSEKETDVTANSIEEAMRLAVRRWKGDAFTTVICGFRYNLPERDEHGINALFHQMAASFGSMNGVYYDNELGNNCFVQNASTEALRLWQKLKSQGRL